MRLNFKQIPILGLAALVLGAGCNKNNDLQNEKLSLNQRTTAYTHINDTWHTGYVNNGTITSFDPNSHQAWFNFHTIDSSAKGFKSDRDSWHLGFWNGAGFNRVILNYSAAVNAKSIPGETDLNDARLNTTEMDIAYDSLTGGAIGTGAVSTYDYHHEGEFVIGTPDVTDSVYLVKTPVIQVHPDTLGTPPVNVDLWLVAVKWNTGGSTYDIEYRPVVKSGSSWVFTGSAISESISKSSSYQYSGLKFGTAGSLDFQPVNSLWNLGLSAVTLKRYFNPAFVPSIGYDSYAYSIKGVVLNNNSGVEVYTVKNTSGGAPGPYDPIHPAGPSTDPAISTSNESRFINYNVDSLTTNNPPFSGATQEEIGQYWRYLDMGKYQIFLDRFFLIKTGNAVYKLKFDNLDAPYYNSADNKNGVDYGIRYRFKKIATIP
ncbi:hypothetical protein [Niabella aquatica]